MRKLLAVLSIFVFIIIALSMLFNTVLVGTAQLELKTLTGLPDYQSSYKNLRKGLSYYTRTNQKEAAFQAFKNFLLDTYSNVFNNPNIEFQFFDEYSLVLKWIGRTNSNKSVFFIADQFTQPLEQDFHEAEMDSFQLKGEGVRSGKITLISELEVLNHFLQKDILPEKNLYFIFPHHDSSILKINHAIAKAKVKPEFVLRPGGMIINDHMPPETAMYDFEKKFEKLVLGRIEASRFLRSEGTSGSRRRCRSTTGRQGRSSLSRPA